VNLRPLEEDLDCVFPLVRLRELEEEGTVGSSAPTHYSFMGYTLRPESLLSQSVPAMIRRMKGDQVDLVLLAPF
jgi:D-proline reductase (dithiol) PrdB